ncbi:MAG: hypothetical protein KC621_06125 [Myxococcales bacterium]|nr:hypothetical protein [Myxococcales bacterium]
MGEERAGLDWLLLGRYALVVALCELIPIPLLDGWVENRVRRRMVRLITTRHGIALDDAQVALLADASGAGCMGCFWAIVMWPVKKLLKTVLIVFQAKTITDRFSEVLHRALLTEEACELGLLPEKVEEVRKAMDQALAHVDTRPVERKLVGTLRDAKHELNGAVWESARVARERLRDRPAEALADAAEGDQLPQASELSRVLTATVQVSGLVPELVKWFHGELGLLQVEPKIAGLIEPELVPSDIVEPATPALPMPVEDAVEVVPEPDEEG